MNKTRLAGIAVAGSLALATPFLVAAQGAPGDGPRMPMRGKLEQAHARPAHPGHHGWHGERAMAGAGFLRGLDLTEEQRDRIFAIRHASEPAIREQFKILRSARGELSRLALSTDYDEAKVKALVDRNAQAMSTLAQMRARDMNQIFRVLSPEQQATVLERRTRMEQRGPGRGPGEGRRGAPGTEGRPATPRS
ncbi:MAG: Spy/CpxP family protein refolding chaperone [Burkholderiaceae bacterium]|nr:Spy/CpxP family protein refolding chaperone [Burkholderiaceae bacterium]